MKVQARVKSDRIYFKTFDAIRFFAFFKVFLFHIPVLGFPLFDFLKAGGGAAVSLFFALSGFLITYIVLQEKKETGSIDLSAFYLRRIVRIWPLYYLMLLFAFLTPTILSLISMRSSGAGYTPDWLMSALFLENYKMIATNDFPNVSPLSVMWSLCIEEHFYIVWGLVLYLVAIRNVYRVIAVSILTANIARIVFYQNGWAFLDLFTNIDYFAYGAIPALLLIRNNEQVQAFLIRIHTSVKVTVLILSIFILLILPNMEFHFKALIEPALSGIIFSILISLLVFEAETFTIGHKNIFSRLGIYTYGFYLTHTIVINFFMKIFEKYGMPIVTAGSVLLFTASCLSGTILAGVCTYYLIEKPFLTLKKRFS